ncbi:MAG TPA: BlaI/MecI/CopY family transcriptional regulator [Candidatus Angelobacter sp.]|jgi:predicted transcriptional regulator
MTSRKNPVPPTRAELRILNALWELKSGTIEEIIHHPSFSSPPNYKTTQTILRIMEEKGLARHTTGGRVFVFEPAVSREWVEKMCVRTMLEQNFGGSPAKLLVNLLESGPVADEELDELEALIRNYRIQKGELQH